jgi:outer membrane biosynthesis protein TonB
VKVFIGEGGRVASAEIVEFGDPPNFTLANAALAASRNWTFEPARLGELPVSSEMILHFRFGP